MAAFNDEKIEITDITAGEKRPETFEAKPGINVHSYEELVQWFQTFGRAPAFASANGELDGERSRSIAQELEEAIEEEIPLFVIAGPPGTGKSKLMRSATVNSALYIEGGRISPFGLYCDLYPHRFDPKIVIDDAESVLKESDGRNLAKGICQTTRVKTVSWRTMSKALKERDIPRDYQTTASMGIITNEMGLLKHHLLGPLLSRGVLIEFTPSNYEIHAQTKGWFLDGQSLSAAVYDFIECHLDHISQLDMRIYYTSRVMARRGQDWKGFIKEKILGWDSKEVLAEKLMADPNYPTIEARLDVFKQRTGYGRTTFNNIISKRDLRYLASSLSTPRQDSEQDERGTDEGTIETPKEMKVFDPEPEPMTDNKPDDAFGESCKEEAHSDITYPVESEADDSSRRRRRKVRI